MFAAYEQLKLQLKRILQDKKQQGYDIKDAVEEYKTLPDDYEAINQFAKKLSALNYSADWQYLEPESLDNILKECARLPAH